MASMCDVCKCSTYYDDVKDSFSCENECLCCNGESLADTLALRVAQILELTEEKRAELEEAEDMGDSNPIIHGEQGPNRFYSLTFFFTDNDGVKIEEDLDLNEITVQFFNDYESKTIADGPLYDWAMNHYKGGF